MCRRASFSGDIDGMVLWFVWFGVDWILLIVSVRMLRGSVVMFAVDSSHCLFALGRVNDQLVGSIQPCCMAVVA